MSNFPFRIPGKHRVTRSRSALRRICAGLIAVAALSSCASSGPTPRDVAGDRLLVLTTFTVLADIAREVGGSDVYVESVTKIGAEIHGYEPTPDDLRRAADADLILENGLGLDAWFEKFTATLDVPRITVSDGVAPIPVAESGAEAVSPPDGADPAHNAPNPHAWMSPLVGAQYAQTIANAFAAADPAHASEYRANADRYAAELIELNGTLTTALATIPEPSRILATCEGAFSYLARDAGLSEVYLWPVNAEQQATPRRMETAINAIRDNTVPAAFCESTVSANSQKQVARESGAEFAGVLYVDSLSGPDGPVPTYRDLLTYDVDLIIEGLSGTENS
jgi:manganese transport system substrate-binding protein